MRITMEIKINVLSKGLIGSLTLFIINPILKSILLDGLIVWH